MFTLTFKVYTDVEQQIFWGGNSTVWDLVCLQRVSLHPEICTLFYVLYHVNDNQNFS